MPDLTLATLTAEQIHQIAMAAKNDLCSRERTLTGCLLEIDRRCLHFEWGTSTTAHYAEAVLQLDGHTAREYMRTGRSLQDLPKLAEAYYEGRVPRCKIREITRVATPETEDFWLDAAAHHNTRQIEMMVARTHKGRKPGEPDDEKGKPRPVKTRVTLDFEPDQLAIVREAVGRACEMAGESISLSDAIELMAQEFLNMAYTETDLGNRYRLVIHADPASKLAWVNSPRGTSRVSDETLEQALCDAEVLDLRKAGQSVGDDGSRAENVGCGDHASDEPCANRPTWDIVGGPDAVGEGVDERPTCGAAGEPDEGGECENERPTCGAADDHDDGASVMVRPTWDAKGDPGEIEDRGDHPVWDTLADIGRGVQTRDQAARLSRTVPPAVMRHVMARDQYRCSVPGCEMRIWKEVHHITWRSDGGNHDKENLVLMCTRHHRMIHRGQLVVSGTPSSGLAFRDQHGRLLQGSSLNARDDAKGASHT